MAQPIPNHRRGEPGAAALPPWAIALTLAAALVVLLSRRPETLTLPQFWAEDGRDFFAAQYRLGIAAFAEPYAGYFHFLPRLTAWLADALFAPRWAPLVYNASALAWTLAALATLLDRRLPLAGRPALVLAAVCVPHAAHEVFGTITNVQWVTALALLATLCKDAPADGAPRRRVSVAMDVAVVAVAGLTGPFVLLFLPIAAAQAWLLRDAPGAGHRRLLLAVAGAACVVQLSVFAGAAWDWYVTRGQGAPTLAAWGSRALAGAVGQRLFIDLLWPWPLEQRGLSPLAGYALLLTLVGWLGRERPRSTMLLLAGHVIVLVASLAKVAPLVAWLDDPRGSVRYFYIPYVLLAWLLVDAAARCRGVPRSLAVALLAAMLTTALMRDWRTTPGRDFDWPAWAARIGREPLRIPINPEPWVIELPARQGR